MKPRIVPAKGVRHRHTLRTRMSVVWATRDLSPHLLRDIGLEPPAEEHYPPLAALMTRI